MKAISLHQPHASLLVTRTIERYFLNGQEECPPTDTGPMVKRFETRSWPCPPALIGQPIAFASTQRKPIDGQLVGDWLVRRAGQGDVDYPHSDNYMRRSGRAESRFGELGDATPLPLGAVVGSGRITASYPIYAPPRGVPVGAIYPHVHVYGDGVIGFASEPNQLCDWSYDDQLPYGEWSPGRFAWLIEDAAPTSERCPWCWGAERVLGVRSSYIGKPRLDSVRCPVCHGAGRCDPIPALGRQRIWNWQP